MIVTVLSIKKLFTLDFRVLNLVLYSLYRLTLQEILMKERVAEALNEVRPSLQADGGDIELIEVKDDGTVMVKLVGACAGCPMSQMTLKQGVENYLKKVIPEVKSVESI